MQRAPVDKPSFLRPIELAINHALQFDPESLKEIEALHEKTIEIRLRNSDRVIFAHFKHAKVYLNTQYEGSVAVRLEGSMGDFLALAKQRRDGQSVGAGQVEIQGDLGTAQRVQNLLRDLDIDFEEMLARSTSDIFAYRAGQVVKSGMRWLSDSVNGLEKDFGEYMLYEKHAIPTAEELAKFSDEVDAVVLRLERVESRIQQLKDLKRLKQNPAINNQSESSD